MAHLPVPPVSQTILYNLEKPNGPLSQTDRKYFQYLRLAEFSEESAVDDFAAFLLTLFQYDLDDRVVRTKKEMSFYMAGQRVHAKADVVLMGDDSLILLAQEDKRGLSNDDPEPQLVAEAIAAFWMNNLQREKSGLPPLAEQTIPGITMLGAAPIFYRITVTTALINALITSTYPAESTTVLKYIPKVPNEANYLAEGMRPLANRRVIFQCFEAFKAVI